MVHKVFSNDGQELSAWVNTEGLVYMQISDNNSPNESWLTTQHVILDPEDLEELIDELNTLLIQIKNGQTPGE